MNLTLPYPFPPPGLHKKANNEMNECKDGVNKAMVKHCDQVTGVETMVEDGPGVYILDGHCRDGKIAPKMV